jgi:hypothetical protein
MAYQAGLPNHTRGNLARAYLKNWVYFMKKRDPSLDDFGPFSLIAITYGVQVPKS